MSATKEARIKELEAEVVAANQERDEARTQAQQAITELQAVTGERDQYKADYEAARQAHDVALAQRDEARDLVNDLATGTEPTTPATEGETDPYAEEKDAMRRNGLAKAWVTPDGQVIFSEKYAREWAGTEEVFATLETITAE